MDCKKVDCKTSCSEVGQLLSAYMDGQLEKSQQDYVSSHLKECAACQEEWRQLRKAVDFLHQLPDLPLPPEFRSQLRARIAEESSKPVLIRKLTAFFAVFFRRRWTPCIALAFLVFLSVGLAVLWPGFSMPWEKNGANDSLSYLGNEVQKEDYFQEGATEGTVAPGLPDAGAGEDSNIDEDLDASKDSDTVAGAGLDARENAAAGQENRGLTASPLKPIGAGDTPAGDQNTGQKEGHSTRGSNQETIMMLVEPEKDAASPPAAKILRVTELTLQTDSPESVKKKIATIAERYDGNFVEQNENQYAIRFPASGSEKDFESAVAEISEAADLLKREQRDQNTGVHPELRDQEQQSPVKEPLSETGDNVSKRAEQSPQIDSMPGDNIVQVNLKHN